jgi:hypothetical protein
MTDTAMNRRLRVSTDGTAGPYIMVSVSDLGKLRQVLEGHGVSYWVEEDAISLNGRPHTTVVNLGRGADARAVQRLLDSAA